MNYQVVIPTTPCKRRHLEAALAGLWAQSARPDKITVLMDRKPWDGDTTVKIDNVEIIELDGRHKLNRCHQAVNDAMTSAHGLVMLMDDDYLFESTSCASRMLAEAGPSKIVVPSNFCEAAAGSMFLSSGTSVDAGGSIRHFQGMIRRITLDSALPSYRVPSIHPMRGHPKLLMASDFNAIGGYDTVNYQHYWWRDTDLHYRIKTSCTFHPVSIPVIHVAHGRYNHSLFLEPNSAFFMRRHPIEHLNPIHAARLIQDVIR